MAVNIRMATPEDVPQWLDLLASQLGHDYPAKEIYSPEWAAQELDPASGHETWVADVGDRIQASISYLKTPDGRESYVANLGRNVYRPESFEDDSAAMLLQGINQIATQRNQMVVARVPAHNNAEQILHEQLDYACVGYQPFKHMVPARVGVLFYVRGANPVVVSRLPISESLPQVSELATTVLSKLQINNPLSVRDGVTGYPLQGDLKVHDATFEDFDLWRIQALASNPPIEISGSFNLGLGFMRVPGTPPLKALLGQVDNRIMAGLTYYYDDQDRCVRLVDAFSLDDLSLGCLLQQAMKVIQEQCSPVYIEADILMTAPRLLKTAEQLGFVPVTYLPAFFFRNNAFADVVKMVKLNMAYSLDGQFTTEARSIVQIIDHNFQDQKIGVAVINLLRTLPIFDGLGDGELRKVSRLFTQKLFRAGDKIFSKGDSGDEAYVVMRGQIDILLEEGARPVAAVASGKIFGELAFLDGSARNAYAVAAQPSILLVVQRSAFNDIVHREPHLGMVVMRNIAMDLSNKLRHANAALAGIKR